MPTEDLATRMSRSLAPFTYHQMRTMSSARGIAGALAAGTIERVLPNHYAAAVHARSWAVRARAALSWAGPESALGGTSALYVWGAWDQPAAVSIAAPWETRPRGPSWLRIRRFVTMPAAHQVAGHRAVDPELAVVLAHEQVAPRDRAEAVYRPIRTGIVTAESLAATVASTRFVRARPALLRRIAAAGAGAESYLEETAGDRVLTGPDLAHLARQHLIAVRGELARIDAFDPATLTAFEFDGHAAHGSRSARRADIARDALLATVGIQTVRFDYRDVMERPHWCREVVVETLRRRRLAPPAEVDVPREGVLKD
ncbi:hypothetical protein [Demequina subtropica]|uniref:hypothetical protein n=1 Tax=Demequina subtropica TaxID=1638989 RepID=UPI00078545C0|nr:hypothetical protein [Demequina subtropica]